jgi:hypothetical protein
MSNEQVAQIILPYYKNGQAEQAANSIVKEAANQWKMKEDVIDDITCVVVFLDTQLLERSLRIRQGVIDQLEQNNLVTD